MSPRFTEDKGLEKLLREQRDRFRFATEAAEVGYWFCDLPFDKLNWDDKVKDHFWLPPDVDVDIRLFYECIHEEDREKTRLAIERSIETKTQYKIEYRTVSSDGRIKWIRAIGRTAYSSAGDPVYFDGVTLDVSEQRFAQDEAQRQFAEIETIYRTAPIGLALFEVPSFRYLRLNDREAAFFGLPAEQILGKTLPELAPIDGLRELFEQASRGEPVINYPLEGAIATDPTEHRYWTVSYFPVYDAAKKVQAITSASLEVTQQKKAEKALIESEKLAVVGRLASSIAHEINNPLESLTNLLYLAQGSSDLNEVREYLNTAERELRRVAGITVETLRFHKQASKPTAMTAQGLIYSVLSVYQGRIVNSHVSVLQRLKSDEPVLCFEGEIRQVMSNLVSNALDAMSSKGGTLFLRSRVARRWSGVPEPGLQITVADTGPGIEPQVLGKLFNPFFTTKGFLGTGLGLWITKQIVERHRGALRVRSSTRAGASGTVFTLFLPFDAVVREYVNADGAQ
jgi:PAS domain S-box-containing protein